MIELRDYQIRSVDMTREALKTANSVCVVIPTGGGKTAFAAGISEMALSKGKRVLFVAPRRSLVTQAHESFKRMGLDSGIYMSQIEFDQRHKIDIASIDTLLARLNRPNSNGLESVKLADILYLDEAHCYASEARAKFINEVRSGVYGKKKIILLTATPCTSGGGGLGNICDKLIVPVTMRELIDKGYLLQPRYFNAPKPSLSKVQYVGDDYNQKQLGAAYDDAKIIGGVVENWLRIAPGTSTVVFAPTRATANHLVEEFRRHSISAAYLDANTPDEEREEVFDSVQSGKILVICNVLIVGMGVDIPRVQTISFATATKSVARWMQGVGRGMRPFGNQKFMNVIDHGGMSRDPSLGPVEDIMDWDLAPRKKIQERIEQRKRESKDRKEIECPGCHSVFKAAHQCPWCDHQLKQRSEPLEYYEADLQEMNPKPRLDKFTMDQKQKFYSELVTLCGRYGFKDGWIANTYRQRFGVWPRGMNDDPIEPSRETQAYVGILLRKFREGKRKSA